ncbi:MAG: heme o synthase [Gammaproteobacteria bacterium]|nr:heme o synthase [Gammaproteobacteria bacterium]
MTQAKFKECLVLCKFRVVALMLLSAAVAMLLTDHSHPITMIQALFGIGCVAASGGVFNQLVETPIDQKMQRTKKRPLLTKSVSFNEAWGLAIGLMVLGTLVLYFMVNTLTALICLAGMIGYAWVYTCHLKHLTPQNIVVGGLNGALPPLLGWTAVTNEVTAQAWCLVLIIYTWTPPHFWALAVCRQKDYANAKIPMLPVTHGKEFTYIQIILYSILMVLSTVLPVLIGLSGLVYSIAMLYLNSWFMYLAYKLYKSHSDAVAMQLFKYSIAYLAWLYIAMLVDHYFLIAI